ncbi:MAG: hypothetical protein LUQ37_03290 [Methanoregulaceae archaeon]|jgi:hypothetical protein|nr:hypothetical protein [Methanoregulaceae archaeon]
METVRNTMDPRIVDIALSAGAFVVFLILIWLLPLLANDGIAYLAAIILFVIIVSAAGILLNQRAK